MPASALAPHYGCVWAGGDNEEQGTPVPGGTYFSMKMAQGDLSEQNPGW